MLEVVEQREVLGKDFKIYGTIENPLFLAKDVATWIDYSITNVGKMLDKVDENEKVMLEFTTRTNVTSREQDKNLITSAWFLTEEGLYEVLMQSRKPLAKEFKKKIKEILKALRLNKIQIINTTNDVQVDNNIMDMINILKSLTEQNQQIIDIIKQYMNTDTNIAINNTNDEIEKEILNLSNDFYTIKECCTFLNNKSVCGKSLGVQIVNQLFRDNKYFDKDNSPISLSEGYFKPKGEKTLLTKQGFILLYRLAKEQVTVDYMVRRGY